MNINEIWNTFQAIYGKVAPVLFVLIFFVPFIVLCLPGNPINRFRALLARLYSGILLLNKSRAAKAFSEFLNKFKLNILTPIIIVIAIIWFFVTVSDFFEAIADYTFSSSVKDLFVEKIPPNDLAIFSTILAHDLNNKIVKCDTIYDGYLVLRVIKDYYSSNSQSINTDTVLSTVYDYYSRESYRLGNKYPERYKLDINQCVTNINKHRSRYGGFLVSAILLISVLIIRLMSKSKILIWFDKISYFYLFVYFLSTCPILFIIWKPLLLLITFAMSIILLSRNKIIRYANISIRRVFFIFLIMTALVVRYRLHYEWAYENRAIVISRISAITLQEEKQMFTVNQSLIEALRIMQKNYRPEKFWFARIYDDITVKYLKIDSYRPMKKEYQ